MRTRRTGPGLRSWLAVVTCVALAGGLVALTPRPAAAAPPQPWVCEGGTVCPPIPTTACTRVEPPTVIGTSPDLADGVDDCIYWIASGNSATVVIGYTFLQPCERDVDLKVTNPPCTDQTLPIVGLGGTNAPEISSQPLAPLGSAPYTSGYCTVRKVVGRWAKSLCAIDDEPDAPSGTLGVIAQRFYPVKDEAGYSAAKNYYSGYTVEFTPNSGTAPLADFTWTPTSTRFQVAFDAGISTGTSPPLTYAWSFEPSQTATGITATHTFPRAGSFPVTLTVTDRYGRTATKTRTVSVQGPIVVNSVGDKPDEAPADAACDTGSTVSTPNGARAECTLRAAVQTVNAGTGNAIHFDIPTAGSAPSIAVASRLPDIAKQVAIDGTTQPGDVVAITGGDFDGLTVTADSSVVKGLAISGFGGPGLTVTGSGTKVVANRFGTDATGTQYRPSGVGVLAADGNGITIGGSAPADGNQVVAGANSVGIYGLSGPSNPTDDLTIRNNTIGLDPTGSSALGPGPGAGVLVLGDGPITSTITGNVVTATKAGIAVVGTGAAGSAITANTVGMDRARSGRVGSPLFGIRSDGAKGTTIGNNAVAATGWDVSVSGSIQGNFSATSFQFFPPTGGAVTAPVTGGEEKVVSNRVGLLGDGSLAVGSGSEGITVWGGTDRALVQDNTVAGHTSAEVRLIRGKDHRVLGNRIGLDPTGGSSLGGAGGIVASATPGIEIGTSAADGNQIGGVSGTAILLNGNGKEKGGSATVAGNRIGLLSDGSTAAGVGSGISVTDAPGSTIGPENTVGNSRGNGISISPTSAGTTITANRIGTDVLGIATAPNEVGVVVLPPSGSDPIKVDLTISGNTVGGNRAAGIVAVGGGIRVLANRLGVGPTSLRDLGNDGPALTIDSAGGEVRGNLVGFNVSGITAAGAGLVVADNQVGQPAADETDIGNDGDGIAVAGSGKVTGNVVGHNGGNGIDLSSAAKVEVRANRIAANDEAGIRSQATDGTIIRDNRLGLSSTDAARPNGQGVRITAGTVLVKGNRIGASTAEAISVDPSATATLTANAVYRTGAAKPITAAAPPAPPAPTVGFAVRKGTGDESRTWLQLTGPDAPGTFEAFGNTDCSDQEARVPMATGPWKGGTDATVLTVRGRADLLGYTVTFTGPDGRTSELSTCATVDVAASDGDGDGIPTIVEQASPWSSLTDDSTFTALPSDQGGWIGLRTEDGAFQAVTPADPPGGRPAGLELPFGLVGFEVKLPFPGFNADVELMTSGVAPGTSYWKYGPADGKPAAWYRFDYREKPTGVPGFTEKTGARPESFDVGGTTYPGYRITFDDGLRGDADLAKNAVIVDPGSGGFGGADDRSCPTAAGAARYVCRLYQYRLGRAPDPSGSAYWVGRLTAGVPRRTVVGSLSSSPEARRRTVERLFSAYLSRGPDPVGLSYWTERLRRGTSPTSVRASLLASSEFYRRAGATNRDWATATLAFAHGGGPTEAEVEALVDLVDGGSARSSQAWGVLTQPAGRDRRLTELYATYLQRTPSASELAYWRTRLDRTITEPSLEAQLLASNEFASR